MGLTDILDMAIPLHPMGLTNKLKKMRIKMEKNKKIDHKIKNCLRYKKGGRKTAKAAPKLKLGAGFLEKAFKTYKKVKNHRKAKQKKRAYFANKKCVQWKKGTKPK